MRKIILFSAMSLDGFIAKPDGNIDWLFDLPDMEKTDHGYNAFLETIDTTLMGRKTYDFIVNELGPEGDIYPGKKNYVFSRQRKEPTTQVEFIHDDIAGFVRELKGQPGRDIWIVGGGEINSILFEEDLIDRMQLQIFPILLNKGIPLTSCSRDEMKFRFVSSRPFTTGVLEVIYDRPEI